MEKDPWVEAIEKALEEAKIIGIGELASMKERVERRRQFSHLSFLANWWLKAFDVGQRVEVRECSNHHNQVLGKVISKSYIPFLSLWLNTDKGIEVCDFIKSIKPEGRKTLDSASRPYIEVFWRDDSMLIDQVLGRIYSNDRSKPPESVKYEFNDEEEDDNGNA
jgi:hypothetical protein